MGGAVYIAPRATAFHLRSAALRVHSNVFHPRQIDDQAAVACAESRSAVAAASNRYEELVLSRVIHAVNDIRGAGALNNQQRSSIDIGVVHAARRFVFRILRPNHRASDTS
jgi:hypothetical protein